MIKVFLVEDETIIRQGIKNNIDWRSNGFELVGEAGDGEYAYPMILKSQPDILLTDVKMPFMDGLELSRLVKKALPRTKIIVISGYNEFDYAKEAIKIGISDYLLKPVTSASLMDALKKVSDQIFEEQENSRLLERYFINYEKYMAFPDKSDYSGVDRKLIRNFLKTGNIEECGIFIDEYFEAVGEGNYMSLLLRQYMTMDIFYCVLEFIKSLNAQELNTQPELTDLKRVTKAIEKADMTMEYLKELFTFALTVRDKNSGDRYGLLIREAQEYIAENYGNSDFSLNMIAGYIGVSPSYFSSIFKQGTGQSFIEYLTKVRIDRACELLRCTTLRTSEIGEQVGYNDPHYFSTAFKKIMGQSPKEFKTRVNQENAEK
ncbi:MAG: response regulator [Lachnospiraceae bacterium]|nr:response regulator [Lachnospiraceae bacterium]